MGPGAWPVPWPIQDQQEWEPLFPNVDSLSRHLPSGLTLRNLVYTLIVQAVSLGDPNTSASCRRRHAERLACPVRPSQGAGGGRRGTMPMGGNSPPEGMRSEHTLCHPRLL